TPAFLFILIICVKIVYRNPSLQAVVHVSYSGITKPMILRPLYCDQLSLSLNSLHDIQKDRDVILLAETRDEATYVKHHKQKLIFQFSAMRHFAQELEEKGYRVR